LTETEEELFYQMKRAIGLLGGGSDILGTLNSRGDTLTDEETLMSVTHWNDLTEKEIIFSADIDK